MRRNFSSFLGVIIVGFALSAPSIVQAAEIRVSDCSGNILALKSIADGASAGSVSDVFVTLDQEAFKSDLLQPSNLQNIALTNTAQSVSISPNLVQNKGLKFQGVSAGQWSLCPFPSSISVQNVAFVAPSSSSGAGWQTAALGLVGLAGLGFGASELSDSDSSNGSVNAPVLPPSTGGSGGAVVGTGSTSGSSGGSGSNGGSVGVAADDDDDADCRVDEKPLPISPFS